MSDSIFCGKCGKPVTGESPSGDTAQRQPCPQCGSLARSHDVHIQVSDGFNLVGSLTANIITYPEALLTTAKDLIVNGQFSIAVVVAHIACEISTERALSQAFAAKGIEYLEEPVEELLSGYNLANDRVRNIFNALKGDEIQKQSFWQAFKQSATLRNNVIHQGKIVTKAEAEASVKAASELVTYLK
jgi:hypothetical protein